MKSGHWFHICPQEPHFWNGRWEFKFWLSRPMFRRSYSRSGEKAHAKVGLGRPENSGKALSRRRARSRGPLSAPQRSAASESVHGKRQSRAKSDWSSCTVDVNRTVLLPLGGRPDSTAGGNMTLPAIHSGGARSDRVSTDSSADFPSLIRSARESGLTLTLCLRLV